MRIQYKLLVSFIMVVLLMGGIQSIFMKSAIESRFEQYLSEQHYGYMERMKQSLIFFYEKNQSWNGVQQLVNTSSHGRGMGMGMGNSPMNSADLLLLNEEEIVVFDTAGTRLGEKGNEIRGKREDVIVNGEKKGELLLYQKRIDGLEQDFLHASNRVIVLSSLLAGLIAIFISYFIAKRMTKPMNELLQGIHEMTEGKKPLVTITTKDEFQKLGESFNQMSNKLIKVEEARKALVADVAHELRTPLTVLQGQLESIQEGAIEANEEVIIGLTDEVYRLNRLVSDLQQLTLAEAGKLSLNKETIELKSFIARICSHMKWLAEEKNISLLYENIPDDCFIELDKDRMTQVIVNLVGNALRHTPENGVVEITALIKEEKVLIAVSDSGPGIPKDVLPFIFDRFYKRDRARSRKGGGTGLGLSIAKSYVEAHGGTIAAESEEGKGTVFRITLPK